MERLIKDSGLEDVKTEVVRATLVLPSASDALTLMQEAAGAYRAVVAGRARRSPGTIRNWCESEGLGGRIGGKWSVSKVALEMFLDGEAGALARYLDGDRESKDTHLRPSMMT
ncbi:hypothetical protein [Bradyrhizobium sp. URHD0069]|uniref:hypothetical protein n=1 Tax=Bradyrhizobium sp. URHD0069 TaxID=1380355 RepID=UPI000A73DFB7|nr:hypothetical protein [Bradyrhizobium sp. URHD0069]